MKPKGREERRPRGRTDLQTLSDGWSGRRAVSLSGAEKAATHRHMREGNDEKRGPGPPQRTSKLWCLKVAGAPGGRSKNLGGERESHPQLPFSIRATTVISWRS